MLTCFIVEDSPVIRQNLVATLEEMLPMQVVGTSADERSAVAWLSERSHRCDLLIIDVFLQQGSGLDVLRHARPLRPDTHMVMLTNFATPEVRRRGAALGADRVFDKSSELDELLAYCEHLPAAPPAR